MHLDLFLESSQVLICILPGTLYLSTGYYPLAFGLQQVFLFSIKLYPSSTLHCPTSASILFHLFIVKLLERKELYFLFFLTFGLLLGSLQPGSRPTWH